MGTLVQVRGGDLRLRVDGLGGIGPVGEDDVLGDQFGTFCGLGGGLLLCLLFVGLDDEGGAAELLRDDIEGVLDGIRRLAVFTQDPEADAHDMVVRHLVHRGDEFGKNGRTEIGVTFHNGSDEDDDLHPTIGRQKVHQRMHDALGNVGETHGTPVNGTDEHIAVHLPLILRRVRALLRRLGNLPLQRSHNLGNILRRHEGHGNIQHLLANIRIGRRKRPQNILQQLLQNFRMLLLELFQPLQNNHHDVIVILGIQQIRVRHRRGPHRSRRIRKRNQRPRRLVRHRRTLAPQHLKQHPHEPRFLIGIPSARLARQIQHQQGKTVPEFGNVVEGLGEVLNGELLGFVVEHEKGVAAGSHVGFGVDEGFDEFGSVGDEGLGVEAVGVEDGQYGIFTNVLMAVLEAPLDGGDKRPQNLLILHRTKKP
mmetsp:Transcript_39250/g.70719  ORF Transcript_39250/g.70719 Transcript_39250/m.70719 type:complete len:423 (-) Transcript_39250:491-1759(-)